jgi:esterase/lipase superfamily enzyme
MTRAASRPLYRAIVAALAVLGACKSAPAPQIAPPPPSPAPALARSATPRSFAVLDTGSARVDILVATTRVATRSDRPGDRYGAEDADQLQFSQVAVNVPSYRARGTGELPRAGTLRSDDPKTNFFVTSVIPVDSNRFVQRVAADLAGTKSRNLLVFVHGFNTSFEDAAVRAAQIAADADFDGTVVLFSWPSAASVSAYVRDQQAARNAGFHLLRLLRSQLPAAQPDHIELLGHSMGSEVIAKALSLIGLSDSLPRFSQVIFAAADIDARVFRREILPKLSGRSDRVTLYASSDDEALRASRSLNGVWRLGLGGDSITVIKGMDTIDASRVRADILGHTLFGNQSFLSDLAALLADGKSPSERRLLPIQKGDLVFWRFRGDPR